MPSNGYRLVWTRGFCGRRIARYEHRVVMEEHLGRVLQFEEHVHHINGDRRDNRLENLEVVSPAEHVRLHRCGVSRNPTRLAEIVAMRKSGMPQKAIAAALGIDQSTVSRYLRAAAGNPRPRWRKAGQ